MTAFAKTRGFFTSLCNPTAFLFVWFLPVLGINTNSQMVHYFSQLQPWFSLISKGDGTRLHGVHDDEVCTHEGIQNGGTAGIWGRGRAVMYQHCPCTAPSIHTMQPVQKLLPLVKEIWGAGKSKGWLDWKEEMVRGSLCFSKAGKRKMTHKKWI